MGDVCWTPQCKGRQLDTQVARAGGVRLRVVNMQWILKAVGPDGLTNCEPGSLPC